MDINNLRSVITVLLFLIFIGIVWWAYSDRRKPAYDQAARIPLDDDSPLASEAISARQGNEKQEEKTS
ncbi:MAG: cbb3-type cytochrome c oxidase subunit 3 [Rugosibacter sp.]|jgi:cytochrome c oxidase cbb3-type subunit 4|nr:K347 [uncultured bacterium]MDO8313962.1 cbb3-type cytochrome c oxidase subunit 3 [Rugosibacter sp.]MDO9271618.1 cbb3-type cytochrome c oxidase subunit 3 [Rugosibacter sp.]